MKDQEKHAIGVSRRQFLGGAGTLAAAGALGTMGLFGCTPSNVSNTAEEKISFSYADTISWDAEYDVVVVGWGGAGSVAAITAAENDARVLLAEKAPYGDEGGNTRYCEQYFCMPNTYEDGIAFFKAMATGFETATDEVVDFMSRGTQDIHDWMIEHGAQTFASKVKVEGEVNTDKPAGAELESWLYKKEDGSISVTEFPTWPDGTYGAGRVDEFFMVDSPDNREKKYWKLLRRNVVSMQDKIDVWFEAPATKLIQDPFTKTIVGVTVSRKGAPLNVRALNGVVLTCGSYEASQEMMANYAQIPCAFPMGTIYNTGDGIKMGIDVGADLWHMDALSGPWIAPKRHGEDRGVLLDTNVSGQRIAVEGSCFYVGGNAKRFMKESDYHKHGHVNIGGTFMSQPVPDTMYAIMDATARNGNGIIRVVDSEEIVEAETIEELAAKIDLDPSTLQETTDKFNAACAAGVDEQFERFPASLAPLETPPYYAVRLWPCCVNAQGGPKRNIKCEVLDVDGNPIPHLYSAGELGSFWAGVYICGGNIAETVYSGREAGANAAAKKDDLGVTEIAIASSQPQDLGNDLDDTETEVKVDLGENQYLGTGDGLHGPIFAKVTVEEGTVTAVEVVKQTETASITEKVWETMPEAMVKAGNADVDTISGATAASEGLIAAVNDAIAQAK